mgnify:CR=1 FL=1
MEKIIKNHQERRFLSLRTTNLEPKEFYQNIEWVLAIVEWNFGDSDALVWHVAYDPIPILLRPVIAKIISGEKHQNSKGISNRKYTPTDRLSVALSLERKIIANKNTFTGYSITEDASPGYAWHYLNTNSTPKQLYKVFRKCPQQYREREASRLNISIATIKKWEKELRDLKKKWPDI